nr:hypothetical protein [Tanacetum cinerariifolium]
MTSPDPVTPLYRTRDEGISNHNDTNRSIIEGNLSTLKELLKEPANRDLIKPILINFNDDSQYTDEEVEEVNKRNDKGKAMANDEDLNKGENRQRGNGLHKGKIINMVRCQAEDRKRKSIITDKEMMKVPITFPPILTRDLLEEALVVEAEIKGYLVRRIHVDEGASIEVLYKHCFNMLHPAIIARLTETQTTVFGFLREDKPFFRGIHSTQDPPQGKSRYLRMGTIREDEEKAALDQGTYYYTKMLFDLKNVGATYRRLVDTAFQSHIGRNLKAYVDDVVVKSQTRREMISDVAVSAVLLAEWKGKQCPVHYVSRTLHDVERNYALLEKLALALHHVSRRLRRGIQHNICALYYSQGPDQQIYHKEEWVLYMDGAYSIKGSGASLVLIIPIKTKYTYALKLNFASTNNQAEYEALLACLRIAKKMRVQIGFVNVDSKLVASQINGNYEACNEDMIKEIHMEACNMHLKARSVVSKAIRQGYYWPTMHWDAREEIRNSLQEGPGNVKFVIIEINYFTKWIEAKPLAKTTGKRVKKFVWDNIICGFGLPKIIVTDNGINFVNDPFKSRCKKLNIQKINTVVAHRHANGLVERENRSLMEGIKTRLGRERKGWVDELLNVL